MFSPKEKMSNAGLDQSYSGSGDQGEEKGETQERNAFFENSYQGTEYWNTRKCHKARHNNNCVEDEAAAFDYRLVYGPLTKEELDMKWRLGYFFMNPYEKFQAKRRIPWKLVLQIIKLIILTYQLIDFGSLRSMHINFLETTELSLKHLYLKDWSLSYETMPYPPAMGKMAAYTKQEMYDTVDFLLIRYNSTQDISLGNFNFASDNDTKASVRMCVRSFFLGEIWPFNQTFVVNTKIVTDCFPVGSVVSNFSRVFNIEQFLEENNRTLKLPGLIDMRLSFSLRTMHLKALHRSSEPDCYQVDVDVTLDNSGHDGQMEVLLQNNINSLPCKGRILFETGIDPEWMSSWLFNAFVLIVCFLSCSLCVRSFSRAMLLKQDTVAFFGKHYPDREVSRGDLLELVDFWYILIVLNDLLSITGCIYKILIQVKLSLSYELCGLLLGTGSLFAWFGVLRYLALFKSFNILIVTVKLAVPNVLKFLVCAFFIFMGFSICGWIVLGPYHIKFREMTTSLECLYSLINGDDIFATFASMNKVSFPVWLFSRMYLYIFMSLFIYVVLSMFISIIADTYDSIKHPDSDLMRKTFLKRFAKFDLPPEAAEEESKCANFKLFVLKLFGYKTHQNMGTIQADDDEGELLIS